MNSDTALTTKQVGIVYFGGLLVASLIVVMLNALSVVDLSLVWQFAPLWVGCLVVLAIGQITMVIKFFRNQYWK